MTVLRWGAAVAGAILLVSGCATAPEPSEQPVDTYLLSDQSAYVAALVSPNRDLIGDVTTLLDVDVDTIVNRVDFMVGSLDVSDEGQPVISGAAHGRFPRGATSLGLRRDKSLERVVVRTESGRFVYFRQSASGIEIAVPQSNLIIFSTDSVQALAEETGLLATADADAAEQPDAAPAKPAVAGDPDRFDPDVQMLLAGVSRGEAEDVLVVLSDPSRFLGERLGLAMPQFPVRMLTLGATASTVELAAAPGDGEAAAAEDTATTRVLELGGAFVFENETQAQLFGRLGRMFILGFVRSLGLETEGLRDSVVIEVDGARLSFGGINVTTDDLVAVITTLTGSEQ